MQHVHKWMLGAIITELEHCGWRTTSPASKITDDQSEALIYNTLYHIEEKHPDFIEMYDTLNCSKIIKWQIMINYYYKWYNNDKLLLQMKI